MKLNEKRINEYFTGIENELAELDSRQLISIISRKIQESFAQRIMRLELDLDIETEIAVENALDSAIEEAFTPYVYNLCCLSDKVLAGFEKFGLRPDQTLGGIANKVLLYVLTDVSV